MNRIGSVVRLQLVGWPSTLGGAWVLLAGIFLVNLALFASIGAGGDAVTISPQTGAVSSIYIIMFVGGLTTFTQVFPFALALSVLRRTFYVAFSLLLLAQSLLFGLLLTLCKLAEDATDGWGIGMDFFGVGPLDQDNVLLQIVVYTVPFVVFGFSAAFLSIAYKRWAMIGMFVLAVTAVVVLGGLAVLITWQQWWTGIGRWIADQPTAALLGGWPLILAALAAAAGYLTIRRVTP
ncbi:ABC transporter permease [Plantactinospora sonchi]|uniref:ABC transporter permease n=1 Tax=Plantactinospora sonchi TaxID=1544735 RepID=A0ABU7RL34_9ACTN